MNFKSRLLLLSCSLFLLFTACKASANSSRPVLFVAQNIAYGQIVIADRPDLIGINAATYSRFLDKTRTTRYAAEFLQEHIEKVTGVTLPILPVSGASMSRPLILVGRSSLTDFVEEDRKALPPEGFIIRGSGNRIAIVGETAPDDDLEEYRNADRGTLFGVYEFLERFGGVRWYFPDELGVIVPESRTFSVNSDVDIVKSPHFKMRTGGLYTAPGWDIHPFIRPGNTTGFYLNHTHGHGVWERYVERNFPGDPEIFALKPDGERYENRPCYSNLKNLEIDIQRVKDWDENQIGSWWARELMPSEKYVKFLPTDVENVRHCQCPDCKPRWIDGLENSKLSGLVLGYAAKFAEEIGERWPGRRLAAGAYAGFLYPPPGIEIPENMDIMITTVKGNAKLVAPGHWEHTVDVIEKWFDALGRNPERVFIWEYFVYPQNDAPNLYPYTMQRWFRFLSDKSAGGFNNGYNRRTDRYINRYKLHILNGWLWHKLLWDPDADVDALMDGFYGDLFGPAYEPMKGLFETAIDRWENYEWGGGLNPGAVSYVHDRTLYRNIFPRDTVKAMEEFLQAAREAAGEGTVYSDRVEFFAAAFESFFEKAGEFHN